jgi:hypothetical protein
VFFKTNIKYNPDTLAHETYYRLVESFRDIYGSVRNRTIVNAGFIDHLSAEKLIAIQTILSNKIKGKETIEFEQDEEVNFHVNALFAKMVKEKKIDIAGIISPSRKVMVDFDTIENKNIREFGAESIALQALEQLELKAFFESQNWSQEQINLSLAQIVSRAVYPASENKTAHWMKENSSILELTGYDSAVLTKDKLYKNALELYTVKDSLEQYLSKKTNELFDLDDKIMLYDLTNTYFEGEKRNSKLAKFGRSKEKRSDAKLVVLGMVVNQQGFIKYSAIFEGNMADSKTLIDTIKKLRTSSSDHTQKALVVIDAGISTEENLQAIKDENFDYLCVTRSHLKEYKTSDTANAKTIKDQKGQKIHLTKATVENSTDYYLKCHSDAKSVKEHSMNEQFKARYILGLELIAASLDKKHGVKTRDKVNIRIGRLQKQYASINKYYTIDCEVDDKNIVTKITWKEKKQDELKSKEGVYFLRTSLSMKNEETVWTCYNTIREIESSFRCLKTDLDLRPIYHKNDDATMAHLHLGLLAYWLVNTIRHQLKKEKITHSWREIVRIGNTQKVITTIAQKADLQYVGKRKCSEPEPKLRAIYEALNYKQKLKFVVLKIPDPNIQNVKYQVLRH